MKKKLKYIFPSVITFIILGVIFYLNHLYPFGKNPLIQNDADYIYIPIMYKIWDLLHHGGSLFYIDMGIGNSIYAPLIIQGSLFSPLNLLLFLVKRDNIINFFSVFIIIKLCLVSLTCYIYINKKYNKINSFYKILFCVLYTFCGFFILNYFNIIWLDVVILFPLLVLYLDKILNNQNELGYIIILACSFIISFYFSFFIIVFILLYSMINLYFNNKENVKKIIFKLGKSTLIAFLLSAFSSLPLIYQIFISSRFDYVVNIGIFNNIAMKSLYLILSPLFVIIFLKLIGKSNFHDINLYKYVLLLFLYIAPLVFDPINVLMHGGSYWCFPYRYGFIVIFILMDACLYYVNKFGEIETIRFKKRYIFYILVIIILLSLTIFLNVKYQNDIISGDAGILLWLNDMSIYKHLIYMIIPIFISYIFCLLFKNEYLKYFFLGFISLYSIFLFTSWTIYYNSHYFLSLDSQEVSDNMNIPHDGRYKVEYTVYGPYYGLMLGVDSLDNWLHLVSSDTLNVYKKMGYYLRDDKIYSYGGTIFSDWFLNLKYIFTDKTKDDDMFTSIDKYDQKELYKINYSNNYGLIVDDITNIDENDIFEYQNILYNRLFNNDKKIINNTKYSYKNTDFVEFDYNISELGYLYFYSNMTEYIDYIIVDGNYTYYLDDSIRYLGTYDDKVNIKIRLSMNCNFTFDIGFIKKSDVLELNSSVKYKNNKYYVDSSEDKYLVMPINNIPGISVYNNGTKVKVYKYLDNFITIKLNKGKNVISIKYEQPLFILGVVLSIIGILLLLLYKKIIPNKLLLNISYYLYIFIISIMIIYMYIYSFFKFL